MRPLNSKLTITTASSQEEREAAYRLRYKVFSLECGDYRHADATNGVYIDEFDTPKSSLIIAKDDKKVVGSLRMVPVKGEKYFNYNNHYQKIACRLQLPVQRFETHAAVVSRGVIDSDYRNNGLFSALLDEFDKLCGESQIFISVGAVASRNPGSLKTMLKNGYEQFGICSMSENWEGTLIYKILNEACLRK